MNDPLTILRTPPIPLLWRQQKLAVLWNAKGGCTFVTKWLFHQMDLLSAAMFYHGWVHHFRINVFYRSHEYYLAERESVEGGYAWIKFVRHPLRRAVSSYTHTLQNETNHNALSRHLGREIGGNSGFSFEEFLSYLETIDLTRCDIHYKVQVHALESAGLVNPDEVIQIEYVEQAIGELERSHGLKETDLSRFRYSPHHVRRISSEDYCGSHRFPTSATVFPDCENFYNEGLVRKVAALYSEDFERYGYSASRDDLKDRSPIVEPT